MSCCTVFVIVALQKCFKKQSSLPVFRIKKLKSVMSLTSLPEELLNISTITTTNTQSFSYYSYVLVETRELNQTPEYL